ncbi:MAG: hypothetical protein H0T79_10075 [Deltaproteobacteria bacterium]|nr:hypothetical protein [Deltaproteobacteria bacterium]
MKTLAEIAIDAGLITKSNAAKAGRMADERKQPLIAILIRELGVDEVALVGALRTQTRVPLIDPADVQVDAEALGMVPRDVCARLRVLPLTIDSSGGSEKVLRIAMADPTDTTAIAEIEQLTECEIELTALPLSAIEELVEKGYRQTTTAITRSPGPRLTSRRVPPTIEQEVSVTAQIPMSSMVAPRDAARDDVELRLTALVEILMAKGVFTEEELAEALRKRGV